MLVSTNTLFLSNLTICHLLILVMNHSNHSSLPLNYLGSGDNSRTSQLFISYGKS